MSSLRHVIRLHFRNESLNGIGFRSVWIFTAGLIVVKSLCCFTGLIMYAQYETCDPITTKAVEKNDQVTRKNILKIFNLC